MSERILLTGASSYVGARLYQDLKKEFSVLGTYNKNKLFPDLVYLDMTDSNAIERLCIEYKPTIILHAAAISNTVECSRDEPYARLVNEKGTSAVVDAANLVGAKVLFLSSDAVFHKTFYGSTKVSGESDVLRAKAGYLIFRPSMIFGASPNTKNDRPHNRLLKALESKTPVTFDTSYKFFPTWIGHLSEVISQCIHSEFINRVIPVVVPEMKSRYDVAHDILTPLGVSVLSKDDHVDTFVDMKTDVLSQLNLPIYTYDEIIRNILSEMKE